MLSSFARLAKPYQSRYNVSRCSVRHIHVKHLIPIWVQCLLYDGRRLGLFTTDRSNSEGIRKPCEKKDNISMIRVEMVGSKLTEDISFVQAISSDDWLCQYLNALQVVPCPYL